jgi:hypothetical protein
MEETMCPNCNSTNADAYFRVDEDGKYTRMECFNCDKISELEDEAVTIEQALADLLHKFVLVTFGPEDENKCILLQDKSTGAYEAGLRPADAFYPSHVQAVYSSSDCGLPHIIVNQEQGEVVS